MFVIVLLKYWLFSQYGKIIFFYDETLLIRKLSLDNLYLKTSAYNERIIGTKSTSGSVKVITGLNYGWDVLALALQPTSHIVDRH